jgi:hypothetical protein
MVSGAIGAHLGIADGIESSPNAIWMLRSPHETKKDGKSGNFSPRMIQGTNPAVTRTLSGSGRFIVINRMLPRHLSVSGIIVSAWEAQESREPLAETTKIREHRNSKGSGCR